MNHYELRPVYTVNNPVQAEIIQNALEAEGIRCVLDGEGQGGFTGVMNIRLLVAASDEEQAARLIQDHLDKST